MSRPAYIIVSDGVSEDRTTNLVSVFTISERIVLQVVGQQDGPPAKPELATFQCQATAVWMHESGDADHEYVHQFVLTTQDGSSKDLGTPTAFKFSSKRVFQRFRLHFRGKIPPVSGIVLFESRIRRKSNTDWMVQSFPLQVDADSHLKPY